MNVRIKIDSRTTLQIKMRFQIHVLVISIIYFFHINTIYSETFIEENLQNGLFQNYDKRIRPAPSHGEPVDVDIDLSLVVIKGVNEKDQVVNGKIHVNFGWIDDRLAWNSSQYGDIKRIIMKSDSIWRPDIILRNGVGEQKIFDIDLARVYDSGYVFINALSKNADILCDIDASRYPFDEQTCSFIISTLYAIDSEVYIHSFSDTIDMNFYEESEEWTMLNTSITYAYEGGVTVSYTNIHYNFRFRRQPIAPIIIVILPIIFLSFLNQLCFCLPPQCGEKMGMSLVCFLTFTVLLSFVSDRLPRSSINIPIFSIYLIIQSLLSGLTIAAQVLVLHVYHTEDTNMSLVRCALSRICSSKNSSQCVTPILHAEHMPDAINVDSSQETEQKLKLLALKMDRCFGVLIFVLNSVSLALFPGCVLD